MTTWDEQPTPVFDDPDAVQQEIDAAGHTPAESDDDAIVIHDPALRDAVVEGYIVCPHCRANNFIRNLGIGDHVTCEDCSTPITIAKNNIARASMDKRSARAGARGELQQIGPYRVERFLAAGGIADVYLCRHPDRPGPVAVKVLNKRDLKSQPELRRQFLQEAQLAAQIDHPRICRVHEAGEDGDLLYFAMDYVDGGSALDLARRHGAPLPPAKALAIVTGVAEALCEAARHGIVHRDIKPQNILLTRDGQVKLADLGVAKAIDLDETDHTTSTFTKSILGTPAYIAPEQCQASEDVDARADIYSLGATLYHLVTGELPFPSASPFQMMYRHVNEPLRDPRYIIKDLPDDLVTLIFRMMAKDPNDRFPHAQALLNELHSVQGQTQPPPAPYRLSGSWIVAIILALLCLIVLVISAILP